MAQLADSDPADVIGFWFGDDPGKPRSWWFATDAGVDRTVAMRFGALHARAADGGCAGWAETAAGALALVIVLDQFPRNIYRGTARAFATDAAARRVADAALSRGFDGAVRPVQRLFFYLPFEHSEDIADQERSLRLIAALGDPGYRDYAERHAAIIRRFGRFPHRNAALGRESTAEERTYLAATPAPFG
jgi:uncharacterized protein (DUF924 family)